MEKKKIREVEVQVVLLNPSDGYHVVIRPEVWQTGSEKYTQWPKAFTHEELTRFATDASRERFFVSEWKNSSYSLEQRGWLHTYNRGNKPGWAEAETAEKVAKVIMNFFAQAEGPTYYGVYYNNAEGRYFVEVSRCAEFDREQGYYRLLETTEEKPEFRVWNTATGYTESWK